MAVKTINLIEYLPSSISSREIVKDFLEKMIKKINNETIYLNFSKIEFISRSAAHELLKMKERIENNDETPKEVIFTEMDENVASMIRVVAANKAYNPAEKPEFKPKEINIRELLV